MGTPVALNRKQSRLIDQIAIEQYGFSGLVLMENAGRGVVDVLLQTDSQLIGAPDRRVTILCGKGNNAGDGFVIARHLAIRNVAAKVLLLCPSSDLRGDALHNYEILTHCNVPIAELSESSSISAALDEQADGSSWLVDAILGTGAQGEPRSPFDQAIDWMNRQAAKRLALDLPSGLDCDTGQPARQTVRADLTCTFVTSKVGFQISPAEDYLGQLYVVSIGIPPTLADQVAATN